MLPQFAFERLGLEMTATMEEVDARMLEISEDPKLKLTSEDRLTVQLMREAAKWARRFIRDPSSCRPMSAEEYAGWSKMKRQSDVIEPTLEIKHQQLQLELDAEVGRHCGVEAKLRNENIELGFRMEKMEAQIASQAAEIERLNASVDKERADGEKWLKEERQHRYKLEDHSKLRDSLFDMVCKDRYRLQCLVRQIRPEFEGVVACVEEMKGIIVPLEEDIVLFQQQHAASLVVVQEDVIGQQAEPLSPLDVVGDCCEQEGTVAVPNNFNGQTLQTKEGQEGRVTKRQKTKADNAGHIAFSQRVKDFVTCHIKETLAEKPLLLSTKALFDVFEKGGHLDGSQQLDMPRFSAELGKHISEFFPNARRSRTNKSNGFVGIELMHMR
jgi:uncharacterized coiled-coil protein SlyX